MIIERSNKNFKDYYETIDVIRMGGYVCVYKGIDKKNKGIEGSKGYKYRKDKRKPFIQIWNKGNRRIIKIIYRRIYSRIWKYEDMLKQ